MPKQNAITLLKADHAAVKKLFAQEQKATKQSDEKKQSIFDQINDALTVHATIEEEIFYPAVKKARAEHVKDEVREGYEEHQQIKNLLAQIARITPDDESWDMKIKVLKEDVEHHVKEEEGEMFPDARKFLGEKQLIELGGRDAHNSFLFRNHALLHHGNSDTHGRGTGALAIAGLQHVELAVLDGELEVLHILVMLFQTRGDVSKLVVNIGHDLFEFEDRNRCTHA